MPGRQLPSQRVLVACGIVVAGDAKKPPLLVIVEVPPVAEHPELVCEHSVVYDLQEDDTVLAQRIAQLDIVFVTLQFSSLEADLDADEVGLEVGLVFVCSGSLGSLFGSFGSLGSLGSFESPPPPPPPPEFPCPSSRAGGAAQCTDTLYNWIQGKCCGKPNYES